MDLRRRAARKGLQFEFELAAGLPIVMGRYTGPILARYGNACLCAASEPGEGVLEHAYDSFRICLV